jgi:hypothetical protein
MPVQDKIILRETAPDWYTYGILITEFKTVEAFFREIEARTQSHLTLEAWQTGKTGMKALFSIYDLIVNWPYRSRSFTGLGAYFLGDEVYKKPDLDTKALGSTSSRLEPILRELTLEVSSPHDLEAAIALVEARVSACVAALT